VLENELTYENDHPNIVVACRGDDGEGLGLHARNAAQAGTLVINTHYTPE